MAAGSSLSGRGAAGLAGVGLESFLEWADQSWLRCLDGDPETEEHAPNKSSRRVKSGHFVLVKPTPLPDPLLIIHSTALADSLRLTEEACCSPAFLSFFSGHGSATLDSWATPYALSIYGQQMYQNCPFGDGTGYGDGRAISVAEVLVPSDGTSTRWEFQLKGAGTSPFSRGADGRAVLRSSVREFLASEAMFHLGVSTTRALSLIVSRSEGVMRPWFSGTPNPEFSEMPKHISDPRLAHLPLKMRSYILQQLKGAKSEPDVMVRDACAITCRVAPSFLRVGHIELFARRAAKGDPLGKEQLLKIVMHAIQREYPEILELNLSLSELIKEFLKRAARSFATLASDWLRVGYTQGNFNSDNCLVAGYVIQIIKLFFVLFV